ncbi:glycosyltransferase family 2 protein [Pedobacter sp. AW31-3R]|uniref:glycosyltransferase family 2 protein n=1 Tax=Pedobacter sp. AW31-3R TaxID=3445781 RepID=UPI003F9F1EDA
MCKITVVMPVKNGGKYLTESIESVLEQTFTDFEFLIFDDSSSDNSVNVIHRYEDSRINLITETSNYIDNLNRGIELSKGKYIARMDQDDIMYPEKLQTQFELMENNDIDVCGTAVRLFGETFDEPYLEVLEKGVIEDPLLAFSRDNFIHNSTAMIRKAFLIRNKLRYEPYFPAEDYKFWIEIAKRNGKFYMIHEPFLNYRISAGQAGTVNSAESKRQTIVLKSEIQQYLKQELHQKTVE